MNGWVASEIAQNRANAYNGYRTHTVYPNQAPDTMPTAEIQVTSSVANRLHFYLTWVSDFSNVQPGVEYPADDFDLYVEGSNGSAVADTWHNSTEHAVVDIPAGMSTWRYRISLYNRNSNPNANIYLAVAWTAENLN